MGNGHAGNSWSVSSSACQDEKEERPPGGERFFISAGLIHVRRFVAVAGRSGSGSRHIGSPSRRTQRTGGKASRAAQRSMGLVSNP